MEEISKQRGFARCGRSLFNRVSAKHSFKLFPLLCKGHVLRASLEDAETLYLAVALSFFAPSAPFFTESWLLRPSSLQFPSCQGFFCPFLPEKQPLALSAEQGVMEIVVFRLHSVLFLSTLLVQGASVDIIIVFFELSWNMFLEGFSFLLIFITRRALEGSARPRRQLQGWVWVRDARGKSLLPACSIFIPRCKEKEVTLVSALIEDP